MSTFTSMHYVYRSAKTSSGYVVTNKQLPGTKVNPLWCAPSLELCQQWITQQLALTDAGLDKPAEVSYNVNDNSNKESSTMTTVDINSMSINELASLQLKVATRLSFLLQQQHVTQSVATTTQSDVIEAPVEVPAPVVESDSPSEAQPSNEAEVVAESKAKRSFKIKSKKQENIEQVAAKIEENLCKLDKEQAKAYIKKEGLLVKQNMKCECLNDAILAYQKGGVYAIPAEYLTAQGKKAYTQKEVAVKTAVKKPSPKSQSKSRK